MLGAPEKVAYNFKTLHSRKSCELEEWQKKIDLNLCFCDHLMEKAKLISSCRDTFKY